MKPLIALTIEELKALLAVAKTRDHRIYVMFLLASFHGLRVSEVTTLRRKNFTLGRDGAWYLRVQRLKGSLETTQSLLTNADPLLDEATVVTEFIKDLRLDDHLFPSTRTNRPFTRWAMTNWILDCGLVVGLPRHKLTPHVLKHTCGVLMRQAGCKLEEIQSALGHKNIGSTLQYLRLSTDEIDSARARAFSTDVMARAAVAGGTA